MLHRFDDYPIHQSAQPLAHVDSLGANVSDRYFFNGYKTDTSLYFAATLGVYPSRGVIDAALSVVVDGEQVSTLASGRAPLDRTRTRVGPLQVEVLEPMRTLRFRCRGGEGPLQAELVFQARTAAIEEPSFTLVQDGVTLLDFTRLTQWGRWEGWISLDGRRIDVESTLLGSRDRSWGVQPMGEQVGQGAPPRRAPQYFGLRAPLNFADCAVQFDTNEFSDGRSWHNFGAIVPRLLDGLDGLNNLDQQEPTDIEAAQDALLEPPIVMRAAQYVIDWEPGTRRSSMASIILEPHGSADTHIIRLEPLVNFQMAGLGYRHPDWSHGIWHGEEATANWRWRLAGIDPAAPENLHVHQVVSARWGSRIGIGVLDQLALGNHDPSGLSGLHDGAP